MNYRAAIVPENEAKKIMVRLFDDANRLVVNSGAGSRIRTYEALRTGT